MTRVNVAEAKARLSELIDAALEGEEVVISRRNNPVARLTALGAPKRRSPYGILRGRIRLSADFDELPADFAPYAPRSGRKSAR